MRYSILRITVKESANSSFKAMNRLPHTCAFCTMMFVLVRRIRRYQENWRRLSLFSEHYRRLMPKSSKHSTCSILRPIFFHKWGQCQGQQEVFPAPGSHAVAVFHQSTLRKQTRTFFDSPLRNTKGRCQFLCNSTLSFRRRLSKKAGRVDREFMETPKPQ